MPGPGLLLLALSVGSYGTLIGAGGGFLLMPALLFLYPVESPTSLATLSFAVVSLNALSGTLAYWRKRRIDPQVGLLLASVSIPGTMLGAVLARFIPRHLFEAAFGTLLVLLGVLLLRWPEKPARRLDGGTAAPMPVPAIGHLGAGAALSGCIGLLSGILGIGGSPLHVIVLSHVLQLPPATAMPTAQFMVLLSALSGVGTHLLGGEGWPDLPRLVWLGVGVFVGAPIGARLSDSISASTVVRLLAVGVLGMGLGLVFKSA